MSVQTGSLPPPGPASTRFVDRARFRVRAWQTQPNPIWIRELRQAARLTRTPVILTVIAAVMTLIIASLGAIVSADSSPAQTGTVIFHTFFSIAYFVVMMVGPAVAANSIAAEREGRTWEAVLLTGLPPATIARGKFLAAFTAIGMYIVMLAPVGALAFLFGGVTAVEVVVAFIALFLIALLAVAFGLAISSTMASLRAAIVVTLLLAFPLSIAAFSIFGVALSAAAHRAWPAVVDGGPIWLPTAYARAPFDADYAVFLLALPLLSVTLPAWFFYEVTIANLTSVTDDRSTGLKRWFLVAAPAIAVSSGIPIAVATRSDRQAFSMAAISVVFTFLVFCAFLFAGDPIGPSRRVVIHWDRRGAGAFRRFLGPGVMRSAMLLLAVGGGCLGLLTTAGFAATSAWAPAASPIPGSVLLFAGYTMAFFVFVVGLGAFLRARATTSLVARVLFFAILFGVSVGPWIVAAIAGLLREGHTNQDILVAASPSPFFAFVVADAGTRTDHEPLLVAGIAAMLAWAVVGIGLLAVAGRRCSAIIQRHEAILADGDRILAAEDEAARAAVSMGNPGGVPQTPPVEPPLDTPSDDAPAEPGRDGEPRRGSPNPSAGAS